MLYGLAGSRLVSVAREIGLAAANEVFADRSYQDDGSLTPRGKPGAMIEDVDLAVAQVVRMVREGKVRSVDGKDVAVQADTLCIHGDQPNSAGVRQRHPAGAGRRRHRSARAARLSYPRSEPVAGRSGRFRGGAEPGQARRSRGACSSASCSEARR